MKKLLALLFSSVLFTGCILDATGTGPDETTPIVESPSEDGPGVGVGNFKNGGHEPASGCWDLWQTIETVLPDGTIVYTQIPTLCDPNWKMKYRGDPDPTETENPIDEIEEPVVKLL